MSVTINPCETTNNCNFKGKMDRTEQGVPYYKTNSGTVAGTVMAVPAGFFWLSKLNLPTTEEEAAKNINKFKEGFWKGFNKNAKPKDEEYADAFVKGLDDSLKSDNMKKKLERNKKLKARAIPAAIAAAGLTLGCGMLVDKFRNDKAKEVANTAQNIGTKKTLMSNNDVALSNKGRAYYESNQGSKYGALLGAGCGITHAALKGKGYIGNALIFALGGWIMGMIADRNTNNDARKHA